MTMLNFKSSRILFFAIIITGTLIACASTTTVGKEPSRQLTQDQVRQCEDGSSPVCVTRMGHPVQCSCSAREDMRRIIERPGDDAIFTPTDIPGQ